MAEADPDLKALMEELRREFRQLRDQMSGVQAAMQTGFSEVRKDVSYLGKAYLPLIALTIVALVLSITGLVIALENRSLILTTSAQTSENTRDLEHLIPLIQPPSPGR